MRRFTFLPWDIYSWKTAFAWGGNSGRAMLALMLAEFLQLPGTPGVNVSHENSATIWLIRAPLTFLAALLVLAKPSFARIGMRDLRLWYLLYVAFFTLSIFWSTSIVATAGKSFELILAILIILQASKGKDALRRLEGIYRLTLLLAATLALVTVLGFFTGSPFFTQNRAGIFTSHTAFSPFYSGNGLGVLSITLLLIVFAEWQLSGLSLFRAAPQAIFATGVFLFSSSRTSLGLLLIGFFFIFFRRSKLLLAGFGVTVCSGAYFFGSAILVRLRGHQSEGSFDTLTGRTVMWVAAIKDWEKRPLLGYGGGVGGKFVLAHIGNSAAETMSHLHNGFLECLTGLGLVGFVLSFSILVMTTFRVFRMWKQYPEFAGFYIWMVCIWIVSSMGMGAMGWMDYLVVVYLVLIAQTDLLRKHGGRANFIIGSNRHEHPETDVAYA